MIHLKYGDDKILFFYLDYKQFYTQINKQTNKYIGFELTYVVQSVCNAHICNVASAWSKIGRNVIILYSVCCLMFILYIFSAVCVCNCVEWMTSIKSSSSCIHTIYFKCKLPFVQSIRWPFTPGVRTFICNLQAELVEISEEKRKPKLL